MKLSQGLYYFVAFFIFVGEITEKIILKPIYYLLKKIILKLKPKKLPTFKFPTIKFPILRLSRSQYLISEKIR